MVCIANYNDNLDVIGCTRKDGASGGLEFLEQCEDLGFTVTYKTVAELEAIALEQAEATQKAEAQKYLDDTDFYFNIDKYATLTDLKKAELTMLRANARDVINGVVSVPTATIPTVVTKEQGILALSQAGLLTTIEATIANSGDEAIITEWANATELRRDCVSLIALCQILGITDEQLDNLFLSASVL